MKKREKKLQLSRETILRLEPKDLREAAGGVWTSCIEPNCCGFEQFKEASA
jgi:hypothetical protein